jgi:Ca2+-binding RTX toxin-like protein
MVSFVITPNVQTPLEGSALSFNISILSPSYAAVGSYKIFWRTNATADHAAGSNDFQQAASLQALTFSATSAQSFSISLNTLPDNLVEGDEFVEVDLYDFQGAFLQGSTKVFTIRDAVPDLVIRDFSPLTASVVNGTGVSITARVSNGGTVSSSGFTSTFYLSTDSTIEPGRDIQLGQPISSSALGPNAIADLSRSIVLPSVTPGHYFLGIITDSGNSNSESSEVNNSASVPITITAVASEVPTFSIAALSADKAEGNSGSTPFTFTVSRTGDLSISTTVNWSVGINTPPAASGSDFVGGALPSGILSFGSGESSKTLTVNVVGDTTVEGELPEHFTVSLSNPGSAGHVSATAGTAEGLIRNDDSAVGPVGGLPASAALIARLIEPGMNAHAGQGYDAHPMWSEVGKPTPGLEAKVLTHTGVDITANQGADIHAFAAGIVVMTSNEDKHHLDSLGNFVLIRHPVTGIYAANASVAGGREFYTIYLHMDQPPPVLANAIVGAGAYIGDVGKSGAALDVFHLHFELRLFPDEFDPFSKWWAPGATGGNIYVFQEASSADLENGGSGWLDPSAAPIPPLTSATATPTPSSDQISGGSGPDIIDGLAGNDTINDAAGLNYLRGGDGDDSVTGGADFDDINGNAGSDTLRGGGGGDWVVGGKDNDMQSGDAGDDIVWGNLGNDTLDGGDGNDQVRGGQGDDVVNGGAGNDYVSGDRGNDTVTGGAGGDFFHGSQDAGIDRITDFHLSEGDRVELDLGTFYTLRQVGADTVIEMGSGNQMILVGIQLSTLKDGWIFEG